MSHLSLCLLSGSRVSETLKVYLNLSTAEFLLSSNASFNLLMSQEESLAIKSAGKAWYQTMISDSDYTEFDNFTKWLGASQ